MLEEALLDDKLDPGPSSVNAQLLAKIVESRDLDGADILQRLGGVKKVARLLDTDLSTGIRNDDDHQVRMKVYGRNYVPSIRRLSYIHFLLDNFNDLTIIMLCIAAAVSLILGLGFNDDKNTSWIEGTAILVSVLIVVNVQAINDYMKDQQFHLLNAQVENIYVNVLRGGKMAYVPTFELMVGDVIVLQVLPIFNQSVAFFYGVTGR